MVGGNKHKQSREQRKLSAKKELAEIEQITARLQVGLAVLPVCPCARAPVSTSTATAAPHPSLGSVCCLCTLHDQMADLPFCLQERMDASEVTSFSDFPLSARTKRGLFPVRTPARLFAPPSSSHGYCVFDLCPGLQQAGFVTPTDIQKDALARGLEVCLVLFATFLHPSCPRT